MAQAGKLKAPVEVTSLKTEDSRVLATPRGTLVLESYAEPQWTRGRDGGPWRKIDTRLERRADGSVAPVATLTDVTFTSGGSGPTIRMPLAEGQVSLSWPGELPAPTLDGDTAVYASLLPEVDLRLRALRDGFTWALVVKSAQAAANPALDELRFALRTTGSLTKRSRVGGGFEVADRSGRSVLSAGGALMWDSAGVAAPAKGATGRAANAFAVQDRRAALRVVPDRARKAEIPTGVQDEDLVIRPDRSLLRGKSTVYPVVIDPWSTIEKTRWGYSSTNDATRNDGVARVGKDPEGSGTYRSYFSFKLTSLSGKTIRDAKFLTEMTHSWDCGNTPVNLWRTADMATTGKQTWSGPSFSKWLEERSAHAHKPSGGAGCSDDPQPDKPMEFSSQNVITDISANRGQDIYTLALSTRQSDGSSESTSNWWKKFDPVQTKLTIEYNTNPNTPTAAQLSTHAGYTAPAQPCVTGASRPAVRSDFPWLKATVSDPDGSGGGSLSGVFTLQKLAGSTWTNVSGWPRTDSGVAPGAKAELQLTTKTVNGELYRWQVQTKDTLGGASVTASPWCEFSIDYSAPASTPTVTAADGLYLESPPLGANQDPHGAVGYSGSFTFAANGASDVYDYVYQVNGGPEVVVRATGLGGPATAWVTPTTRLENVLTVRSRDQAGNSSAPYDYTFLASDPSAPVAHWAVDDGSGLTLTNKVAGGAVATMSPSPAWTDSRVLGTSRRSGKDWAVKFDGNDQAVTAGPVINTSRSFSFAAWVRADAVGGVVMAQVGANKSPFELQYYPTKQRWCFVSYVSDSANAASTPSPACATDPVQVGVWVHLTGVYDAGSTSQLALYVNGVRKGSGSTSAPAWASTGPLSIGVGRNGTPVGWVNGAISEVRVWDRVIDPETDLAEIVAPVRVGQWEMDGDDQDEPREAGDSSDYRNALNLKPAPASDWVPDSFNGSTALRFDGISGNAQTSVPVLRTDQSYTVSAWVRFAGGNGARTVIAQDGLNVSSSFLSCRTDASGSKWSVMTRSADATSSSAFYVIGTDCLVNQWTHLVAVQDVTTKAMSLYVNGVLVKQSAFSFVPWHGVGVLAVGRGKWGGPADYFSGDIDRVQVWQGALNAAEVQAVSAITD
ncbi:LamG domain-containing protein [Micromonospora sp. WMMD980]|uniref:LamG domain-containing protein n=1 Tax=Micromonospora sp. WMMD980 TaxID=3016088 RepID=UPI002416CE0B|nr:LamG domain-containing protein [Micromonospora sp. WMMD980]MDG4802353.1 LamG domain-containing protein [Micromonospora sp. WMMD980]